MNKKGRIKPLIASRIRDRSEKNRPKTIAELVTAIDDGRLDGRTAPAKRISALRAAIAKYPLESCIGVVRDALALDLTVAQVIVAEITKPGFQALVNGKLNPTLEVWNNLQKSLVYTAQTLSRLEASTSGEKTARGTTKTAPSDISTIILEAAE